MASEVRDERAEDDFDDHDYYGDCSWCGGEGIAESDDPMWDDDDWVRCPSCGGSGRAEDMTIW
jgi:DnaJ-class molecular chaperone